MSRSFHPPTVALRPNRVGRWLPPSRLGANTGGGRITGNSGTPRSRQSTCPVVSASNGGSAGAFTLPNPHSSADAKETA